MRTNKGHPLACRSQYLVPKLQLGNAYPQALLDEQLLSVRIKSMGRSRYKILNEAYPYFHTITVAGWQPVFTQTDSRFIRTTQGNNLS
ncbi:MAG: hypothetical protein Q7U30_01990, partial [Methylicorpusculum sp.]|nr:hypothetical protein [Methylicorpusculum sp.]